MKLNLNLKGVLVLDGKINSILPSEAQEKRTLEN